ncbi:MAG: translocation/assembly module TamB [Gemmatimonadota bacterium]|nr:translocation/assembly module TamB [Gemmatimonadota bacterium]
MTRRNFIALVSLCVLVALGAIVVGVALFATQSEYGQTAMSRAIEARVKASIHGKVHVGRVSGSFLTGVTIDSLELRDDEDSLVVATGKVTVRYDPRDLVDRRLYFTNVELEHPQVVLRQHENWQWNYRRLFGIVPGKAKPKTPERGFGDFVILDSIHIRKGGSLRVTIPWHADDSLHGARKDSAIKANVAHKDHEVRHTAEGLTQTYRWSNAYAAISHLRIAEPDSVGIKVVIDTLNALESTPPFKFRNVQAVARVIGDSAWFTSSHWDLPHSTGSAEGKVVWGSDLPVRYAAHITADSASLVDVGWVYPTLPTTGGGKMKIDIVNEKDLQKIDYVLRDMDVRTTKSRLRGTMTFEVGGPVLSVHDVKLQADPVDFDLLRTLNGKPFPADWQGTLTGTVTARGGPLTKFFVDASDIVFRDAHVPGAVSRLKGRGELDILFPAFTAFHNFSAQTEGFDLRTLTAIYPAFPRVTGIIKGSAVLDSSWLDVRVSNADLTHTDGPAEPTHATGGGRITYGTQFMRYDLDLLASPLSLTTLAKSYPKMVLRGALSGPIHVSGIAPDLDVQADLTGPAGHILFAGKADADSLGGYGANGSGSFDGLNAAAMIGLTAPTSRLAGTYRLDVNGDSLANLRGPLSVRLGASTVDSVWIAHGLADVRFAEGVVFIDTLRADGEAGVLRARGTLGLTRSAGGDSLAVALDVDSLGGLRRYLAPLQVGTKARVVDALNGSLAVRAMVRGWLDSLDVRGTVAGKSLAAFGQRADALAGTLAISDVLGNVAGTVHLRGDSLLAGGLRLDTAGVTANILSASHARFSGGARTPSGGALRTAGDLRASGDTTSVRLEVLDVDIGASRWALNRPANFLKSNATIQLDTLVLASNTGALLNGFIDAPTRAPIRLRLRADSIPMSDLGTLAGLTGAVAGRLSFEADAVGTRAAPEITATANMNGIKYEGLTTERVTLSAGYQANRVGLEANMLRDGRSVLDATLSYPAKVTLFSFATTDDSLRGRVHADSVDLAMVEALSTKLQHTTGRVALDLQVSGRPDHPHLGGSATITNGAFEVPDAGVKLAQIDGAIDVDAAHDSLSIHQLRMVSPVNRGTATLSGSLVYRDIKNPILDLRLDAHSLRAVDKRGLARLDVSTDASGLTLTGTPVEATMTGAVIVDRGTIYIPELIRTQVVDITPEDFAQLFDTTDVRNRSLMPQPPAALVEHLRLNAVSVRLGDDVWLRSREANIKLGGSLNVTRTRDDRATTRSTLARGAGDFARYKLALSGSLSADRGTYTLDLTAVQREFQVQSGRITFFGTPDFNPEIDVTALYNVKQGNRADIGIKARIFGPFYPQPALDLSSTDAYLSPSDLVSYLVTGRASFEQGGLDVAASQRAAEFLLPTVNAAVSRALRDQLGGFVDLIQIQSGAAIDPLAAGDASSSPLGGFLYSTRLGGEKQIKDRLFLSFSTGLCQLRGSEDTSQQGVNGFVNAIEGKLEYRFPMPAPDRLSLRAGREPAASALRCSNAQVRGFVSTPQQWGFSVFRSWAF